MKCQKDSQRRVHNKLQTSSPTHQQKDKILQDNSQPPLASWSRLFGFSRIARSQVWISVCFSSCSRYMEILTWEQRKKYHQWHQKAVDFEFSFTYFIHIMHKTFSTCPKFKFSCLMLAASVSLVCVCVWEKRQPEKEGVCVPVAVSLMWQYVCTLAM